MFFEFEYQGGLVQVFLGRVRINEKYVKITTLEETIDLIFFSFVTFSAHESVIFDGVLLKVRFAGSKDD